MDKTSVKTLNPGYSVAFMLVLLVAICSAVLFAFGEGYTVTQENGDLFFCSMLLSTGQDDEVAGLFGLALCVPLVWRWVRIAASPSRWKLAVLIGLSFGLLNVLIFTPECGSAWSTLFHRSDRALLGAAISLPATVVFMIWLH